MGEVKREVKRSGRPDGLGRRGSAFWDATLDQYELNRPDELELCLEAARLCDLTEDLAREVSAGGLTGVGSQGQLVANPLLAALQSARGELRNVLRQLRLPDPVSGEDDVTRDARGAARARWS
jgi:hypothetical protein